MDTTIKFLVTFYLFTSLSPLLTNNKGSSETHEEESTQHEKDMMAEYEEQWRLADLYSEKILLEDAMHALKQVNSLDPHAKRFLLQYVGKCKERIIALEAKVQRNN